MFCTQCGTGLKDQDQYCSQCGKPARGAVPSGAFVQPQPSYRNKLSRPMDEKKIAGVCAGFARYLGMDVTLVRIVWIVLALCPPSIGCIAYIVAWIAMPKDPLLITAPAQVARTDPAQQGA